VAEAAALKRPLGPLALLEPLKSPDVQLAMAIVLGIVAVLVPLPPFILDFLLVLSIASSLVVMLLAIYVKEPLEFSTFPTILLFTTMLRLGLNIATTRMILGHANDGEMSRIVKAFGEVVVGGNYLVGVVMFGILVVINFMVITKGAGRVAEVSARFTLDAMPGKQMTIDAELQAGHIDRDEAKRRRTKVQREADFHGSMDGASKYVRGDAIAGLIITFINIIVGLIIGVSQNGMTLIEASKLYTLLTVGEGLVAQLPAVIISLAAGVVVTRASSQTGLSQEITDEMTSHPKALYASAAIIGAAGLAPGMPLLPFAALGLMLFGVGRFADRQKLARETAVQKSEEKAKPEGHADQVEQLLHLDTLALEVGVELVALVDTHQDGEVLERIVSARKQLAQDLGIIVPMVMIRDNIQLRPDEYHILLKGNVIGKGRLHPRRLMAMGPDDIMDPIDGIKTKEPAYGLDAVWVLQSQRDEATFRGYTVVNCATVVVTHLTKLIQEHAADLLGRQETHRLVEGLKREHEKAVEEVIGIDRLQIGDVLKVLQNMLAEQVSIRDLLTIFETLGDHCKTIKHPAVLTRHVRKALGRGIIKKYLTPDNRLVVVTLDRAVEDALIAGLILEEDGSTTLSVDPELAKRLIDNIVASMKHFETTGTIPIIMCGAKIRWDLRKIVARFAPGVAVVAWEEIPSDVQTQTVGIVGI
jgi:flagellar biosynthesis protein FlhA